MAVHVQEVARARDLAGRANECDLQLLAFRYRITLKQDDQPLRVLRHQRRLPSTSAPFVEKICESVFVLECVPCELDDNSLVFFHEELEIMDRRNLHRCRKSQGRK